MKGPLEVVVKDKRNVYSFVLKRNITILTGDSGRGKTTLFDMVADYNNYGSGSSVKVVCDKPVIAVEGKNWNETIENAKNSVIIIDEDNDFIRSKTFAEIVKGSSNYFLIITRSYLEQLPISVNEIYCLEGKKNKKFKRLYTNINGMYNAPNKKSLPFRPDVIITEDSKSGHQFFKSIADKIGIECISASGKSNIVNMLEAYKGQSVLVIADGAAFGTNISNLALMQALNQTNIGIYLPESFEWLILKSGIVNDPDWEKVSIPEKYIDSEKYISWERYFTELLVETTKGVRYKQYPANKGKLPSFYKQDDNVSKVKKVMKAVSL